MRSSVLRTVQSGLRRAPPRPASPLSKLTLQRSPSRCLSATSARRGAGEEKRQWSTPLAEKLTDAINTTGPIPLASYMRMCLTGDIGGYYTGGLEAGRDQFGQKGDFITSPEISQVFGELIGIWFVAEWLSQGRPRQGVELIEIGPGRGTLMDDMLRTIRNFKDMASSIDAIYLVEASKELRLAQKNLLCGEDAVMRESKTGWHSTCKYSDAPIVWANSLSAIPHAASKTPFIVAHEFFDALPIHAFQAVDVQPAPAPANGSTPKQSAPSGPTRQWREMVVSPTPAGTTHADLGTPPAQRSEPVPEFQLTLAPMATRHATYLPEMSARYRALKGTTDALIEVCPDASRVAGEMAERIGGSAAHPKPVPSGAALVLDYGPADSVPANSLRGIRAHRRVSPFAAPGKVDLSADVDFVALVEAATRASEGVEAHGPVEQAHFLAAMGIAQRADMLADAVADPQRKEDIRRACRRLVDRGPAGMGKVYKALAFLPENGGKRRPVGFGGDVAA
ncbi:DUF185 domain-containing protein [Xylariomycetidae sp. FL0641]|nr:DUF185 domain-containing protein [Xylariomycetidae sp. FL0641]